MLTILRYILYDSKINNTLYFEVVLLDICDVILVEDLYSCRIRINNEGK